MAINARILALSSISGGLIGRKLVVLAAIFSMACCRLTAQFAIVPLQTVSFSGDITIDSYSPADTNYDSGGIFAPVSLHPFGGSGITGNLATPAGSAAIIVKNSLTFSGNSIVVDSYNSADPSLSTAGLYDPAKARDNGDIICNATNGTISVGNAEVFGHVSTGTGGTLSIGANGGIGSHAWLATNTGIEPNGTEGQVWFSQTANLVLPSVNPPYFFGPSPGGPVDIVTGSITNHYDASLSNGSYYSAGTLSGNVAVLGSARLYLPNGFNATATFTIFTNASITLYVGGSSCSIGPATNLTGYAGNFQLWCLPTVTNLTSTANGNFIGVIYAPDTAATLSGGDASTFSLCGSIVAASLAVNGHQQFHFDEALNAPPVQPPAIAQQPVSQAALLNSNAAFQVTATGTAPLAYQWRWKGANISGATNSAFAIGSMQVSNIGSYTVVVTNSFGRATSDVATLMIASPPDYFWARIATNANNTGFSAADSMAVDGSGNVYVAGDYEGYGVDFGGVMFTNGFNGGGNFLCKYDANGNLIWARQFGTNSFLRPKLAADAAGNVYMAGDYSGTVTFGTNFLNSAGRQETYLVKFDAQGQAIWARRIGAYDPYAGWPGRALAIDSQNGVVLIGSCTNTADFGVTNLTGFQTYVANYDANGNFLWAAGAPTRGAAVAVGASGMIYVSGTTLSGSPSFLAKYGPAGQTIWSRPFADATSLALDSNENIYVAGMGKGTNGDLILTNAISNFYLAKCSPDGALFWSQQINSQNQIGPTSIALDAYANIYVSIVSASLYHETNFSFGSSSLSDFVSSLLKYDAAGNPLWAKSLGGTNAAQGWGMAAPNPGTVYVAGNFSYLARFGNFSFATPNRALYVAKLEGMEPPALPQITGQPLSQKVRAGTTTSFNVIVPSGIPLTYQWYVNGSNAAGGCTGASLVFANVQTNASGSYNVTVANAYGSVTSSIANLTVYLTEAAALSAPIGPTSLGSSMQFQVSGVAGFNYAVEASTNLSDWIPLTTNTSPFLFVDPNTAAFPNRCYRVRWVNDP